MYQFILASGSPRRKELLSQIGISYKVLPSTVEEKITKEGPGEVVEELSLQKALDVADKVAGNHREGKKELGVEAEGPFIVLGADTIVAFQNEIMGKPKDEDDAVRMIKHLAGNIHQVYTGVTIIQCGGGCEREIITFHEKTDVEMFEMSEKEIKEYVASKEPLDKAGAYAIQGLCAKYIKGIQGDYNNVVGLPVGRVWQVLKKYF